LLPQSVFVSFGLLTQPICFSGSLLSFLCLYGRLGAGSIRLCSSSLGSCSLLSF
jgi:hypothetical protein